MRYIEAQWYADLEKEKQYIYIYTTIYNIIYIYIVLQLRHLARLIRIFCTLVRDTPFSPSSVRSPSDKWSKSCKIGTKSGKIVSPINHALTYYVSGK